MKNEQLTPYLKNAIDLQRYGNKLGGDVVAIYVRAARTLLDDFAAADGSTEERMARLKAQASQIRDTIASAYGDQYPELLNELTQLANQQTKFNAKALKSAVGVGVSVRSVAVSAEYVQALAAGDIDLKLKMSGGEILRRSLPRILPDDQPSLNAAIADLANSSSKILANTLRSELLLGKTNDEIARGLLKGNRIPKGSPLKKTERAIRTVIRSAVIGTASEAQMLAIAANRDITTQYEFVATLDSRTTLICMALDGKIYSVDDSSAPRPPLHLGCRSTTIPYLGDLSTGGTRASAKGQVDSDLNYEQWLRQQPEPYQDEALGRGKASLFRNGMGLSQMVREDGSMVTVEQLRGEGE